MVKVWEICWIRQVSPSKTRSLMQVIMSHLCKLRKTLSALRVEIIPGISSSNISKLPSPESSKSFSSISENYKISPSIDYTIYQQIFNKSSEFMISVSFTILSATGVNLTPSSALKFCLMDLLILGPQITRISPERSYCSKNSSISKM
jgi:hypothetical protein